MTVAELKQLLDQYPDQMPVYITDEASWIHPDIQLYTTTKLPSWCHETGEVLVIS